MTKVEVNASVNPVLEELTAGWRHLQAVANHAAVGFALPENAQDGKKSWSYLPVDLFESDEHILLHIEIPGMEVADFDITVFGNNLVISGIKKPPVERGLCMFTERAYGEFERSIPLSKPVNESEATATYLQGVLTVQLPVLRDGFCRRIEVQGE